MSNLNGFGTSKRIAVVMVMFLAIFVSAINANADTLIYDSSNYNYAYNNPTIIPEFTIATSAYITEIWDYHYNNNGLDNYGRGATPGTIGLERTSGTPALIGTWNAVAGPEPTPISWYIYPNVLFAPGTYKILDSDIPTWSTSWNSGGDGHAANWVPGIGMSQVYSGTAPVPLPGAFLLFAPGLVGLAAIRRRFKK